MSSAVLQIPADRGVRLLAVGDVHLGTRPGSLPDELSASGIHARDLAPAAALEGAVAAAIHHGVDAVLFAGLMSRVMEGPKMQAASKEPSQRKSICLSLGR